MLGKRVNVRDVTDGFIKMNYGLITLSRPYRQCGSINVQPDYWETASKINDYNMHNYATRSNIHGHKYLAPGLEMCYPHLVLDPDKRCVRCHKWADY